MTHIHRHPVSHSRLRRTVQAAGATLALALLAGAANAQLFELGDDNNLDRPAHAWSPNHGNGAWYKSTARRNVVRYGGNLYTAVVRQSGSVEIRTKPDDVCTPWGELGGGAEPTVVNDASSGIEDHHFASTVAMALTSTGYLHITWGRFHGLEPESSERFRQYYRCYDLNTGAFTHPSPQDVTLLSGGWGGSATDAMAIAVGPNDEVYMAALHLSASHTHRLYENGSNWIDGHPTGSAPSWLNRGLIPALDPNVYDSNTSSNLRMAVDSAGRVQMTFRRFIHSVTQTFYSSRVYDPSSGWSAITPLHDPSVETCDSGYLATTTDGDTHLLYQVRSVAPPRDFELRYTRRTGIGAWDPPTVVATHEEIDIGSNDAHHNFALAAFSDASRVFAIYRDYKCRRLMMKQIRQGATEFEFISELTEPTASDTLLHDTNIVNVRNTLWPASNRMSDYLDISFQRPISEPDRMVHKRLHISQLDVDKTGCAPSGPVPAITLNGVPCTPCEPRTLEVGLEAAPGATVAILMRDSVDRPGSPYFCGLLYAENRLQIRSIVCGNAKYKFTTTNPCSSTTTYFQWVVFEPFVGRSVSNRAKAVW